MKSFRVDRRTALLLVSRGAAGLSIVMAVAAIGTWIHSTSARRQVLRGSITLRDLHDLEVFGAGQPADCLATETQRRDALIERARELNRRGLLREAAAELRPMAFSSPKVAVILASIEERLGHRDEAVRLLRRHSPTSREAMLALRVLEGG